MDLNKLKSVRISPNARVKIINDLFPDFAEENIYKDNDLNDRHLSVQAGALALYSTTLITKIHETAPETIEMEYTERELELLSLVKSSPKYEHLTDTEIKTKVHEMIYRDLRNSFAHGNFEISYDIYTKKLYYVLQPQRKDFVTDKPIVISKDSLTKANKKFLSKIGRKYARLNKEELNSKLSNNLNELLKSLMLPVEMMSLADHYLDSKQAFIQKWSANNKTYFFMQYALLVTQLTYEQDDYYKIFGKDSNIFEKIAIIRNSIAHDNFSFMNTATEIDYHDKNKSLNEPFSRSISSLLIATNQKDMILRAKQKEFSEETLQHLTNDLKQIFDLLCNNEQNFDPENLPDFN